MDGLKPFTPEQIQNSVHFEMVVVDEELVLIYTYWPRLMPTVCDT